MAGTLTISTLSDGTNSTSATNCISGSAKAWVSFNGTTTPPSIRSAYNVGSITKNGTGYYTINYTNAFADSNYSIVGGVIGSNGNWAYTIRTNNSAVATTSATFSTGYSNSDLLFDIPCIHISVFR